VSVGNADVISFPGILSGGGEGDGFFLPKLGAGVSVGNAFFLEFRLAGEGGGGGLFTSRCRCARAKAPGILWGVKRGRTP